MSKEKSPQQKKASSLEHDRRNTYGENSKSSRKNIAKGKQSGQQRVRHAVAENLAALRCASPDEELMMSTEHAANVTASRLDKLRFKKDPDEPLGRVIERKLSRRGG
jgi:hypothetical protein